ncbi:MAG TPA: ATP-binding protein [Planctomycetota bacterium]|nr:ATP-binding protein [Planctomycetota bacterium]
METDPLPLVCRVVQEINAGSDLNEVLQILFDRLQGVLPTDRIGVAAVQERQRILRLIAARSNGPVHLDVGYAEEIEGTSLEELIRTGTPRILDDLEKHAEARPESRSTRLMLKEGMRSSLTVPLLLRGRPFGALFISSRTPGAYTPEHLPAIQLLSGFLACTIEKANLVEEVRRKSELIELIFHHSPLPMGMVDRKGVLRSWNPAAEKAFGYATAEIVGRPYDLLFPGGPPAFPEDSQEQELGMIAKGGERRTIGVTSKSILANDGEVIGRALTWRDLTPLKQLESDLLSAKVLATVGELAAAVAHEVRNPLAGISGAVQILKDGIPAEDPQSRILDEVLKQVWRLDRLVRDLLVYARPWSVQKQRTDLSSLARSVIEAARPDPRARGVLLRVETTSPCYALVDRQLVEAALSNVLQNAMEAVSTGGSVSVGCANGPTGEVRVVIEDNGPGIAPELSHKVFQPFFTTKPKGTGLGLPIVKRIMEAHGGSIVLAPRKEGGTRATLAFPANGAIAGTFQ